MYLLVTMHMLQPVRKSKTSFICTVLNLTIVVHYQHQNYAEHCIGHIKDISNHVLTFTDAP